MLRRSSELSVATFLLAVVRPEWVFVGLSIGLSVVAIILAAIAVSKIDAVARDVGKINDWHTDRLDELEARQPRDDA